MPSHSTGLRHVHLRKRGYKKYGKYPHPDKFKKNFDKLILAIAIMVPVFNLPQLFKIWGYKDAAGVSFISWISFAIFSVLWLCYGILHKEKPLIVMYFFLIIIQVLIAVGAFIYG